jgi:catechol 2,3-dioxygenase-like lactoylglutathione lyase family enzyme
MREFGIRTVDGHRMRFGARRGLGAPAPSGGAVNLHSGMERAVPILPADDLAVAKKFYIEALGFEAAFEWTDDGRTGLLGVRRGTMTLTLDCPMSGHGRNACVSLHVHSADEYYEEWRQRATMLRPPRDEAWGARTFDLADPFGNTIFVIGPATRPSS